MAPTGIRHPYEINQFRKIVEKRRKTKCRKQKEMVKIEVDYLKTK